MKMHSDLKFIDPNCSLLYLTSVLLTVRSTHTAAYISYWESWYFRYIFTKSTVAIYSCVKKNLDRCFWVHIRTRTVLVYTRLSSTYKLILLYTCTAVWYKLYQAVLHRHGKHSTEHCFSLSRSRSTSLDTSKRYIYKHVELDLDLDRCKFTLNP